MTYRELLERCKEVPESHLDDDATVLLMDSDEVIPIMDFVTDWSDDEKFVHGIDQVDGVLDFGHPYLTVAF